MLPFAGYHMGDYFDHWLAIGRKLTEPPRIFSVNWFRKDEKGSFIWPGFGQNMRVLQWIVDRVHDRAHAVESPLGWVPRYEDLCWDGLTFDESTFTDRLMVVDREEWMHELMLQEELFARLHERLPKELVFLRELLLATIQRSPAKWTASV
jgi:phosphoenolpyruvate carboxykinase (GTP)